MTDRTGGIGQADAAKPEVLADAIVNAAEARLSKMTDDQKPKNVEGIMKAATSHLSKREQRETGKVHKESVAAKAQVSDVFFASDPVCSLGPCGLEACRNPKFVPDTHIGCLSFLFIEFILSIPSDHLRLSGAECDEQGFVVGRRSRGRH